MNNGFKNIGLNEYFKRYGVKFAIKRGVFLANPLHFISDYDNKKMLYYIKIKKYLKKKYLKFAEIEPGNIVFPVSGTKIQNPIWIYWRQGLENAPEVVKKCVLSVEKYYPERVVFLSEKNLEEYLLLPLNIIKKFEEKNISNAALSDLIRYTLLEHYGGTWLDATVLMTDRLPKYVENAQLFMYRDLVGEIYNPASRTNWLIHSEAHNNIIRWTRNMSFAYWENEKHVIEYLLSYILMEIAAEKDRVYIKNEIPVSSTACYLLLQRIGNKYSEEIFEKIKEQTPVHKLTYKLLPDVFEEENNFYHVILKGD